MKALALIAFLVAVNAVFGGAVYLIGHACRWAFVACLETPAALVVGILALVAALAFARWAVIAVGSARRN